MQFDGKAAIVTGGGYGIGKAVAISLAKEGADVAVAARNEKALKETAGEIERLGRKSLVVVTNLVDPDAPALIGEGILIMFKISPSPDLSPQGRSIVGLKSRNYF